MANYALIPPQLAAGSFIYLQLITSEMNGIVKNFIYLSEMSIISLTLNTLFAYENEHYTATLVMLF